MPRTDSVQIYLSIQSNWFNGVEICDDDGAWKESFEERPGLELVYDDYHYNVDINQPVFSLSRIVHDITVKCIRENIIDNSEEQKKYLIELNTEQIKYVTGRLKRWKKEIINDPMSEIHKRRISFLETVRGELKRWFDNNGLDTKSFYEIDYNENTFNTNEIEAINKLSSVPLSLPIQKKQCILKAILYINTEIEKLGSKYKKKDIILICDNAYKNIVLKEFSTKEIKVAEYLREIAPLLKHQIDGWTVKKFIGSAKDVVSE